MLFRSVEGRALVDASKGDKRVMMDEVGAKIAQLLPTEYRGAYS